MYKNVIFSFLSDWQQELKSTWEEEEGVCTQRSSSSTSRFLSKVIKEWLMFKMINHKHYKTPTYNYNRQLYVLFPYGPVAFNDGFAVSQWKHEVWNQLRGWWLINVEMIIWALNMNSFILTKHKNLIKLI